MLVFNNQKWNISASKNPVKFCSETKNILLKQVQEMMDYGYLVESIKKFKNYWWYDTEHHSSMCTLTQKKTFVNQTGLHVNAPFN